VAVAVLEVLGHFVGFGRAVRCTCGELGKEEAWCANFST
jgi:hypothetical protein